MAYPDESGATSWVQVLDASGNYVGIVIAEVSWTRRLMGADSLDSVKIPQEYLVAKDGTTQSRLSYIDQGWFLRYGGVQYIVQQVRGDWETGYDVQAVSREIELANFFTNYTPGTSYFFNRLPSEIMGSVLAGKMSRMVKNPGFALTDTVGTNKPTNWEQPTGWQQLSVSNDIVYQSAATAGQVISHSETVKANYQSKYRVRARMLGSVGETGTVGLNLYYIDSKNPGTIIAVGTFFVTAYDGTWYTVESGDVPCYGDKVGVELVTNNTIHIAQFDDVQLFEIGPTTNWTYSTSWADARSGSIAFSDGAWLLGATWSNSGSAIQSTTVGDSAQYIVNGSFVTLNYGAGGVGAKADVYINGVLKSSALDVSVAGSVTYANLDRTYSTAIKVVVNAVKVAVTGLTVSTENRVSMMWSGMTVYDAMVALRKAIGGELVFDTINRTITHVLTAGQDLSVNNVVEFRRGQNLVRFDLISDRTKVFNTVTYLGYGEGEYQLMTTVLSTGLDPEGSGQTSIQKYGTQRGYLVNKDQKDLNAARLEGQTQVEISAWPVQTYSAQVDQATGALVGPGDTGHFVYKTKNLKLRIVEIKGNNIGSTADLTLSRLAQDLTSDLRSVSRQLGSVQRAFTGVPSDANMTFVMPFDTVTKASFPFYVPYQTLFTDLRLQYQVVGMRATSNGSGSSSASTSVSSNGPALTQVAPTRNIATQNAFASSGMDKMSTVTYPYQQITITIVSFSAATESFAYEIRENSLTGTLAYSGTVSVAANSPFMIQKTWNDNSAILLGGFQPIVRVEQTTLAGSANAYYGASLLGWSDHTHGMTHTHPLNYGIQQSAAPANVHVYLDTVEITDIQSQANPLNVPNFSLLPYISKNINGMVNEGWHTIAFGTTSGTGEVDGTMYQQKFISYEAL